METYDIIVIGGGPAGSTSALYASRIGRKVLLLAGCPAKSLICQNPHIDNFPGIPNLNGAMFIDTLHKQCLDAGVKIEYKAATYVSIENKFKLIKDESNQIHICKALIIASGTTAKLPDYNNIFQYLGKIVHTCAWCDGDLYKGKVVAIIGAGNTAYTSAKILSRIAKKVFMLLPKREGTAFRSIRDEIHKTSNVQILHNSIIEYLQLSEQNKLQLIISHDSTKDSLLVDGLFITLGQIPNTKFIKDTIELSASGYILADSMCKTSKPGIFAAGDVVEGVFRQLVVACGLGATAALSAEKYLNEQWS